MNPFVLDCSVAMAWCFDDEADAYAEAALDRLAEAAAVAPGLLGLEIVNVLLVAERRGRITESRSLRFLDLFQSLPITMVDMSWNDAAGPIAAVGRHHRLSAYGAAYLALASRESLELATRDKALRQAAADIGVPLFQP